MRLTLAIDISRPPAAVFPWIAEPEKAMRWQAGISDVEIIERMPQVTGTTFREVMRGGRNQLEIMGAVTEYVPGTRIAFHLRSRVHELEAAYSIEGDQNGSKLTATASIKWRFPANIIFRLRGKKLYRGIVQQTEAELRELKRLCETDG